MDKEKPEKMADACEKFRRAAFGALGIQVKVKKDEDLLHYRRGDPMTLGNLRAIPLRSVVWLHVTLDGSVRADSAYRLAHVDDYFIFTDGSLGGADLENFGANDEPAEDEYTTVYRAVPEQEKCPACKVTLPEGWSVNNRGHKVEHVCEHGVGHTCAASTDDTVHGCDGCCAQRRDL